MKNKGYILLLQFVVLFTLVFTTTGCQSISKYQLEKEYVKKEKLEEQREELKMHYIGVLATKSKEIEAAYDKKLEATKAQMQATANSLYGANEAFNYYDSPGRLDTIINNRVTEAQAANGMSPTYQAVKEENARLKKELDEKKVTNEQLKKDHDKVVKQNEGLVSATTKATTELNDKKKEYDGLVKEKDDKISDLGKRIEKANDVIIAAENQRANEQEAIERMKTKLMWACGIGALIATIGSIYSPVGKKGLMIIAVVLGGATVAIPFIEGWMVLTVVGVIIAVIIGKWLFDHNVSETSNDNLVNAIEDTKQELANSDAAKTLKSNLAAWNTKYVKVAGKTIEVQDDSIEKHIEGKLKKFGRLVTKDKTDKK